MKLLRTKAQLPTLLAALMLAACTATPDATGEPEEASASQPEADAAEQSSDEPISIGFAIAKTGWLNAFDMPALDGAKMAVEEINENGGVLGRPLEIMESDARSDAAVAGPAATELLERGADFLVTMCDYDLGGPSARVAGEAGVVAFSCAASPLYNTVSDRGFTISSPTPAQGAAAAQFVMEQGWTRAYLLRDTSVDFTDSFCEAIEARLEALDGEVVGTEIFQQGDETLRSQVTNLRNADGEYDVIMLCGLPPTGATAIREIRSAGIDVPVFGPSSFAGPGWTEAAPDATDVYAIATTSLWGDDPNDEVNEFYERFDTRPVNDYPVNGYSMVQALAVAVERAGTTDGDAVLEVLQSFDGEPLMSGLTTYSSECRLPASRDTRIIRMTEGEGEFVQTMVGREVPWPDGITC